MILLWGSRFIDDEWLRFSTWFIDDEWWSRFIDDQWSRFIDDEWWSWFIEGGWLRFSIWFYCEDQDLLMMND
jgi:hypothetical protein